MIKKFCFAIAAFSLVACNTTTKEDKKEDQEKKDTTAQVEKNLMIKGDTISLDGAMSAQELVAKVQSQDSIQAKVSTTIVETCTMKGCWMTVDMGDAQPPMRVRFLDYGFFVPTEGVENKKTTFEGLAYRDTLSVEELQHYAYDAGKDSTEILAITKPEVVVSFTATGVIIEE